MYSEEVGKISGEGRNSASNLLIRGLLLRVARTQSGWGASEFVEHGSYVY